MTITEKIETLKKGLEGNAVTGEARKALQKALEKALQQQREQAAPVEVKPVAAKKPSMRGGSSAAPFSLSNWPLVKKMMPIHQQKVVKGYGEEREPILDDVEKMLSKIPSLRNNKEQIVYAHYFYGQSDWFILEYDKEEDLFFGFTILNGDSINAELGYSSIEELQSSPRIELDFYWEVKPLSQAKAEADPEMWGNKGDAPKDNDITKDDDEDEIEPIVTPVAIEASYVDQLIAAVKVSDPRVSAYSENGKKIEGSFRGETSETYRFDVDSSSFDSNDAGKPVLDAFREALKKVGKPNDNEIEPIVKLVTMEPSYVDQLMAEVKVIYPLISGYSTDNGKKIAGEIFYQTQRISYVYNVDSDSFDSDAIPDRIRDAFSIAVKKIGNKSQPVGSEDSYVDKLIDAVMESDPRVSGYSKDGKNIKGFYSPGNDNSYPYLYNIELNDYDEKYVSAEVRAAFREALKKVGNKSQLAPASREASYVDQLIYKVTKIEPNLSAVPTNKGKSIIGTLLLDDKGYSYDYDVNSNSFDSNDVHRRIRDAFSVAIYVDKLIAAVKESDPRISAYSEDSKKIKGFHQGQTKEPFVFDIYSSSFGSNDGGKPVLDAFREALRKVGKNPFNNTAIAEKEQETVTPTILPSDCAVTRNAKQNGVEIRFPKQPAPDKIETLKRKGFRWSSFNKVWYAKYNEALYKWAIEFCNETAQTDNPADMTTVASPTERLITLAVLTKGGKVPQNLLKSEIEAGKLEVARFRRFDGMTDSNEYFKKEDYDWGNASMNLDYYDIKRLKEGNVNTHWTDSISLNDDGQIRLGDLTFRYKSNIKNADYNPKQEIENINSVKQIEREAAQESAKQVVDLSKDKFWIPWNRRAQRGSFSIENPLEPKDYIGKGKIDVVLEIDGYKLVGTAEAKNVVTGKMVSIFGGEAPKELRDDLFDFTAESGTVTPGFIGRFSKFKLKEIGDKTDFPNWKFRASPASLWEEMIYFSKDAVSERAKMNEKGKTERGKKIHLGKMEVALAGLFAGKKMFLSYEENNPRLLQKVTGQSNEEYDKMLDYWRSDWGIKKPVSEAEGNNTEKTNTLQQVVDASPNIMFVKPIAIKEESVVDLKSNKQKRQFLAPKYKLGSKFIYNKKDGTQSILTIFDIIEAYEKGPINDNGDYVASYRYRYENESINKAKDAIPSYEGYMDNLLNKEGYILVEPSMDMILGKKRNINLPNGEKHQGQYAIVELDRILASHNEETFADTPGYPRNSAGNNLNDRNYATDRAAQQLVEDYAQNLNPELLISTNSTPEGTPIINKDGIVVSGNNRTMSLKLAAKKYPKKYNLYKEELKEQLSDFGIDENNALFISVGDDEEGKKFLANHYPGKSGIKNPVLVRIDYDFGELTTTNMAKYNASSMKAKAPVDKAAELATTLREQILCETNIPQIIAEFDTLSDFYASTSAVRRMISAMQQCSVLNEQDMPAYVENGFFTNDGKTLLETILAALILEPDTLRIANRDGVKSLRQCVVNALAVLIANKNLPVESSLIKHINEAIRYQGDIVSSGLSWENFVNQIPIFDNQKVSCNAVYINRLMNQGQKVFRSAIQAYNNSQSNAGESALFQSEVVTPEESFKGYIISRIPAEDTKRIEMYCGESKGIKEVTDIPVLPAPASVQVVSKTVLKTRLKIIEKMLEIAPSNTVLKTRLKIVTKMLA
jgi:ddrB-like ParB superfamily domain